MEKFAEKRNDERIEALSDPHIRLFIQGVARDIFDISNNGFGVLIDAPSDFHLGQRMDDIRLNLAGRTHRLHGAVAHVTRTKAGYVLGIRLTLDSIEDYRIIADLIKRWEAIK